MSDLDGGAVGTETADGDAYAPTTPGLAADVSLAVLGGAQPPPEPSIKKKRHIGLWMAVGWLGLVTFISVIADLLPLQDPDFQTGHFNQQPTFWFPEPFGTDTVSRSILSRLVYGGRVSLTICLFATLLAVVGGTLIGLAGGYFRGFLDTVLDVLVNAMLAFPALIFLIALITILEPTTESLILGLGLLGIPVVARVARANTIAAGSREYVTAARAMGMRTPRIMFREVLPNVLPSLLSFALILASLLIVAEGALSFLGLGIRAPTPSWGVMVSSARGQLADNPYQLFVPATVFFLTVLSLNTIGNWARARVEGVSG